jgi:hypothetical protein
MIEKRLTIGVIVAVAVQTAGALMWAGAATHRLETVESRVVAQGDTGERLARVEVRLEMVSAQLVRIERKLETE